MSSRCRRLARDGRLGVPAEGAGAGGGAAPEIPRLDKSNERVRDFQAALSRREDQHRFAVEQRVTLKLPLQFERHLLADRTANLVRRDEHRGPTAARQRGRKE